MSDSFTVRAPHTFLDGAFSPSDVTVSEGVITSVDPLGTVADPDQILGDEHVLLPGLVDSHVHVNEPGRTEWEGFATATLAAAAGSVTTIVDMPLNSVPPTTTVEHLHLKRRLAAESAYVDVAFWGGAVPGNLGDLEPLDATGVRGFKCFLVESGVEEFGHLSYAELTEYMTEIARLGSRLIVHAEDPEHIGAGGELGRGYSGFLTARSEGEGPAVAQVIDAARATGARTHILHLSDGRILDSIRRAKADGVALTVETCPHYLTLAAEDIPDGAAEFKCCPPIRESWNADLLWEGLTDGTIDAVVSDHSPSTPALKQQGGGDFGLAWGGIAGLQLGLAATWTEAQGRGVPLERLIELFSTGPARIAGLAGVGEITEGADAHLSVFDPAAEFVVEAGELFHRHPVSAYQGARLRGRTLKTWLRGRVVFDVAHGGPGERVDRPPPTGRLLPLKRV